MLDDRAYMRPAGHRTRWTLTTLLMVVTASAYVLQALVDRLQPGWVNQYLALSLPGLLHGFVWQFLSFQFLHGGLWHLIGNLLVIFFFGRPLEESLGPRRFLGLYFGAGVVGGLAQVLFDLVVHRYLPVVGASAGAFGLIAAYATFYPDRTLTLLLFFVVPLSLRARTLLWLSVGLALLGLFGLDGSGGIQIAHAAHLGGIGAGVLFAHWQLRPPQRNFDWARVRRLTRRRPQLVNAGPAGRPAVRSEGSAARAELPPEEFISREVDPILDKISAHGIQSLTERERWVLEAARSRMSRR